MYLKADIPRIPRPFVCIEIPPPCTSVPAGRYYNEFFSTHHVFRRRVAFRLAWLDGGPSLHTPKVPKPVRFVVRYETIEMHDNVDKKKIIFENNGFVVRNFLRDVIKRVNGLNFCRGNLT